MSSDDYLKKTIGLQRRALQEQIRHNRQLEQILQALDNSVAVVTTELATVRSILCCTSGIEVLPVQHTEHREQ